MATTEQSIDAEVLAAARLDLAILLRAAAAHGFNEGIDNHFSLALPGRDDLFLLNRFGPHWSEMRASDILLIDLEGDVVDGEGDWEVTAFMIHRGVHRARPDARCVLHTHMPYATALSMTQGGLETRASQNAMYFHGKTGRTGFGGLADGAEEGDRLGAAVAAGGTAILLDNHGVIIVGRDAADAWHKLYFLERAAKTQVLAQATGSPLILVDEAQAARTAAQWEHEVDTLAPALFAAERRLLDRDNPGYDA